MYLLNSIIPGDIILTRSDDPGSQRIRESSNSEYSHALICVGVSSCIESNGLGVHSINPQRVLLKNSTDAVVLRLKDEKLKQQIPEVIKFAREKIGTEYSAKEAIRTSTMPEGKALEGNRQFCTRFVSQSYFEAGITLVQNPYYCTPQEVLQSDLLLIIDNAVREASDAEIQFAKSNDPTANQTEITNRILEFARSRTSEDIQTWDQLSKFILENPEYEPDITQELKDSGYLTMWDKEKKKNPWRYDLKNFIKVMPNDEECRKQALKAIEIGITRERFNTNLKACKHHYSLLHQEFFKIQILLYEKLIIEHELIEKVGHQVIKHLDSKMNQ